MENLTNSQHENGVCGRGRGGFRSASDTACVSVPLHESTLQWPTLNGVVQTMGVTNSAMLNHESIRWNGSQS